ncbi:MAG: hypothetical protein C4576_04960 [Desulfobacteraceae bacterium]|nr:MAG: hypothetical protein C4576_04960 [Desulfobacteraceae bacterium]
MDLFKSVTVLSSEKTTILSNLTIGFAQDGMQAYRQPVYGYSNRPIGGIAGTTSEMPQDVRTVFPEEPYHRFQKGTSSPGIGL